MPEDFIPIFCVEKNGYKLVGNINYRVKDYIQSEKIVV